MRNVLVLIHLNDLIGGHIEEAFRKASRKVFISTFASNVHRVQQVVDAARKTNRKLALAWSKYGECSSGCIGAWLFDNP